MSQMCGSWRSLSCSTRKGGSWKMSTPVPRTFSKRQGVPPNHLRASQMKPAMRKNAPSARAVRAKRPSGVCQRPTIALGPAHRVDGDVVGRVADVERHLACLRVGERIAPAVGG